MNPAAIAVALALPLAGWRLYARLRRLRGRQRLSARRPWVTLALAPVLVALLAATAAAHPPALAGLAGGVAAGLGLAWFGWRRTVLEATPAGLYYTPSAHVGALLVVLLAVRVAWRAIELSRVDAAVLAATPPGQLASPLTLAVLGALAGYHGSYAARLLRWRRALG